jgi:hypothetical protein
MAKPVRYKDGTLLMPGSVAHELATNPPKPAPITPQVTKVGGKEKPQGGLHAHMDELDKAWRKQEGRKPVAELTERERMLEGRIPWDPVRLKELSA